MPAAEVQQFLDAFSRWASEQSGIQAVALVGSHARGTATQTSDVDLVILADDPPVYVKDSSWATAFGIVVSQGIEHYGRVTSLRVHYQDQVEVEYGFTDVGWAQVPLDEGTQQVIAGGMKVLFERRPLFPGYT